MSTFITKICSSCTHGDQIEMRSANPVTLAFKYRMKKSLSERTKIIQTVQHMRFLCGNNSCEDLFDLISAICKGCEP